MKRQTILTILEMTKQKIYIGNNMDIINMFPSDLKWSLDDLFQIYFKNIGGIFPWRIA
mgnify:CR=1 FL=1